MSANNPIWRDPSPPQRREAGRDREMARLQEQNPMKFQPLHDRVVIRRVRAEEKTSGGIIIPDTAQEKPMEGVVVAPGPGVRNEQGHVVALGVKSGDRVLFGKWSGTEVKLDGEELLIMKESDIMGVVDAVPVVPKQAA
jgi:chaperonin GroES